MGLLSRFNRRRQGKAAEVASTKAHDLTPDGYRYAHLPPDVSSMLRLYGTGGVYSTLYARQPNVRAAVNLIASQAAELNLKMYEKVPRTVLLPSGRVPLDDHDMMVLLAEPAPGIPTYDFWYSLFADLATYDRAYWYVIEQRNKPAAIVRVPPGRLFPVRDPVTLVLTGYRDVNGTEIPKDRIIPFWGYDPEANESAIPPMETLRRILADEAASQGFREAQWRSGLRKDGIIERDADAPQMSDEARESFMIDLEDGLADKIRPLLLEPGMSWKDVTWSPKEMEYLSARKLGRVEVAAVFNLPSAMLNALEGKDPDSASLEYFYKASLPPMLSRVESNIEAKLLPRFDLISSVRRYRYVEFNLDAKLRGSPEEQISIMATAAGGPVITVNEARARLNLPPIEDGDAIFVPLNSVRAGGPQVSPQSPTDTPAIGTNPAGTTPGGGTAPGTSGTEWLLTGEGRQAHPVQYAALPSSGTSVVTETPEIEALLSRVDEKAAAAAQKRRDAERKESHETFMRETRPRFQERHARAMEKYFSRQRDIAVAGRDLKRDRWDRELADDLFGVAYQTVEMFGKDAADRIEGYWNSERTAKFIRAYVDREAVSINDETVNLLAKDDVDFDVVFGEGRVSGIASKQTTYWMNWSILEAARQNGEA